MVPKVVTLIGDTCNFLQVKVGVNGFYMSIEIVGLMLI
jgi:hypothetical protein